MTEVYKQHDAAFSAVSAFVIGWKGERVATVALKFPRDGAGRLYAYVHWHGSRMVRAFAGGYGYDKRSAAVESAAAMIETPDYMPDLDAFNAFKLALSGIGGNDWTRALDNAGFTVWQAV